jgi:hypothetical protein
MRNVITLKGIWECFIIFLKFIKSIIDGLWKIAEALVLVVYFIYGFYLTITGQVISNEYLFCGLVVIYSDVNNTIRKIKK